MKRGPAGDKANSTRSSQTISWYIARRAGIANVGSKGGIGCKGCKGLSLPGSGKTRVKVIENMKCRVFNDHDSNTESLIRHAEEVLCLRNLKHGKYKNRE